MRNNPTGIQIGSEKARGFPIIFDTPMNSIVHFFHKWNIRVSLGPQEFKELLLSHHPNRPCFDDDIIVLFNTRICAGCLFAYPTAFLTLYLFHPSGIGSIYLALAFAVFSQIRRLSKSKILQNLCRIIAGIALGFGIGGGYWAFMNSQWLEIFLLILGTAGYTLLKAYSIRNKLLNCKNFGSGEFLNTNKN